MEYQKIRQALESIELDELYLNNFKDKKCTDSIAKTGIDNHALADFIIGNVISEADHRKQFLAAFKKAVEDEESNRPGPSRKYRNTGCPDDSPITSIIPKSDPPGDDESKAMSFLNKGKEMYESSVRLLLKISSFDVNQFDTQASIEEERIKNEFLSNIQPLDLPIDSIKKMTMDLHSFMGDCFAENFNLFKQQNPEIMLKAALEVACKYYRDEMKKHMISKQFIPDFETLSNKITAEAVHDRQNENTLTKTQKEQLINGMKQIQKKYAEKNLLMAPQESLAIGIDLGTTYSCVAVCIEGKVTIIPNEYGLLTTPSCVAFNDDGSVAVGKMAKYDSQFDPSNICFDSKRLLGRRFGDPEVQKDLKVWPFNVVQSKDGDTPKIQIRGKNYYAEEISARVLRHMKKIAEDHLGKGVKISNAVVTVPAYFNNGQRQATKDAGEIAGLNILKIINEPTAAAIAYKLHRTDHLMKNVLIFDLGGGTFDVAVLTICDGDVLVKAVGGDTHLGGQDFDNELVEHCISKFNEKHSSDLGNESVARTSRVLRRIRNQCEEQKQNLSNSNQVFVSVDSVYKSLDMNVKVTRKEFEKLNQSKFDKCIDIVEKTLADAGLKKEVIDDVVLVGGSTRIPKIQEMLSNFFGGKSLSKTLNPDEAVARGAAIQASILNGIDLVRPSRPAQYVTKIRDVTPLSLGVEDYFKKNAVIIRKNTLIPCKKMHIFTTANDNQTEADFKLYEGEEIIAKENHFLGKFVLENVPSAKAGQEKFETTMEINDEGILHVTAIVQSNRSFGAITISSHQGRLSKKLITELKLDQ